jgi:hypothetical protein
MSEWLHFIEVILTSGPLAWVVIVLSIIRLFHRPISQAIQSLESLDFSLGSLKAILQWLTNKSRDIEDDAEGKTSNHASSGSGPIRQLSPFEIRMAALAANNPLIVIPVAWSEVSRSVWPRPEGSVLCSLADSSRDGL